MNVGALYGGVGGTVVGGDCGAELPDTDRGIRIPTRALPAIVFPPMASWPRMASAGSPVRAVHSAITAVVPVSVARYTSSPTIDCEPVAAAGIVCVDFVTVMISSEAIVRPAAAASAASGGSFEI